MSQALKHFRYSETQATSGVTSPASLSARSFPFTPACPGQYSHRELRRLTEHSQMLIPASHSTFLLLEQAHWICEYDGVCYWGSLLNNKCDCFHLRCPAEGWGRVGCTVLVGGGGTLLDSETPSSLVWWLSHRCVRYEILPFTVFVNAKLDIRPIPSCILSSLYSVLPGFLSLRVKGVGSGSFSMWLLIATDNLPSLCKTRKKLEITNHKLALWKYWQ